MAEANGTVLAGGVTGEVIPDGRTVYRIAINFDHPIHEKYEGKVSTMKVSLANLAQSLAGQRVSVEYNVVQNTKRPEYWNFYLENIAPEGQLQSGAAGGIPIVQPSSSGGRKGGGGTWKPRDPEETKSIVKQNVLGTAFGFVGKFYEGLGPDQLEEAEAKAFDLAQRLFEIAKPKQGAPAPAEPVAPQPTTPAEVAQQVPGVQVGVPVEQTPDVKDAVWN